VGFNLRIKYYDTLFLKKYIIPVAASLFFVVGASFKTTFEKPNK
jgi:hypothetical protein